MKYLKGWKKYIFFSITINLTRDGGVWELPWIFVEVDVIDKVVEGLVGWRNLSLVARYIQ